MIAVHVISHICVTIRFPVTFIGLLNKVTHKLCKIIQGYNHVVSVFLKTKGTTFYFPVKIFCRPISFNFLPCNQKEYIVLSIIAALRNKVGLSLHRVRGLYFPLVIFAATVIPSIQSFSIFLL